jgi:glycine/D-amino acid oxidase-like deaminating enzyme
MRADVVVIGGGLAGLATAWELGRRGAGRVVVLEQEPLAGVHSSGRSAGIIRTSGLPPAVRPLAEEGASLLASPSSDLDPPPRFHRCGTLLLAGADVARRLRREAAERGNRTWLSRQDVEARVPPTARGDFEGALSCPDDGVLDVGGLVNALRTAGRRNGVHLFEGRRAIRVRAPGSRVTGVETEWEGIDAPVVVNAAGAWAASVAESAGALVAPLTPYRRHLFISGPIEWVDPEWPVAWDVSHDVYFRPEPPGLLLSPCDQTPHVPGDPAPDPAAAELLAQKIRTVLPGLEGVTLGRSWAGLRTLAPDGAFVVGRDPFVEGFYWCAGLGGHGVTVSLSVGRLAARCVLGAAPPPAHDPARFGAAPARRPGGGAVSGREA